MLSRACLLLVTAGLAGCAGLLPRSEFATQESWRDYESARAAVDAIVPMHSRRADLSAAGIDPRTNAAVTILSFSDVVQRFAVGAAVRQDELDS